MPSEPCLDREPRPNTPPIAAAKPRLAARLMLPLMLLLAQLFVSPARAATDPCDGVPQCQNLGPFTATVLKVNVTRQDGVTAYQGVRTTLRFTNIGRKPLVLAYRDHSSMVTDDKGLAYKWSAKAYGIGLVTRDSADPQFELAPGESREASFDGVVQYSMRRDVAGSVFTHDLTLVELAPQGGKSIREARDFALNFSGLTATSGYSGAAPAVAQAGGNIGVVANLPAVDGRDACAGAPACQTQGPLVATVVRVNVTDSGGVTAYHVVRTTVRFRNLSDRPVILGYRRNSGAVTDNQGLAYRRFITTGGDQGHVAGIGVVDGNVADPQFRLAPGEAREASFEQALQYNTRNTRPGDVFQHDMSIVELEIVGPKQIRTAHEYALSFSNLRADVGLGAGDGRPAQALSDMVNLLTGKKH